MAQGGTIAGGGAVAVVGTGGAAAVPGGLAVAGGAAMVAHGAYAGGKAVQNLASSIEEYANERGAPEGTVRESKQGQGEPPKPQEPADARVSVEPPIEKPRAANNAPPGEISNVPKKSAEDLVTWVDEGGDLKAGGSPGMRPDAYEYQSGAPGARSNPVTGRSQAPYLEFTDQSGTTVGAKCDGVKGNELVDRKLNPVFSPKVVDQATRQAAVAQHYGLTAVWELPTQEAVDAANRFMKSNDIKGITVRLAPR